MIPQILFAACLAIPGLLPQNDGAIGGVVLNASDNRSPVAGAEVMLRIRLDGQFVPLAETTADENGQFVFGNLMVGQHYHYLPGANRHEIHYPGPRVQLTSGRPRVSLELAVRDSVTHPSPLVIRRHEIFVQLEPGVLRVTETIVVDNPSSTCYVGRAAKQDAEPITLSLAIPSDFERTTFDKEFFGRRFALVGGKLVTGVPWTPGRRELKFTYVLRNTKKHRLWQRPLDLPCSQVRLRVETANPDEVSCNLDPGDPVRRDGKLAELTFQSEGRTLPAGYVVRLELGKLAVPWVVYGRWVAVAALASLVAGAALVMIRRRRTARRQASTATDASAGPTPHIKSGSQQRSRGSRQGRKRQSSSRRRV